MRSLVATWQPGNYILINILYISRCSKLIAYMNLIKKVMLSNASTPSFGPYAQLSSVV